MRTHFSRLIFSVLFVSALFTSSAYADPQLETVLSKNKINPDETATFSIKVKWLKSEAQYQFAFPPFNLLENLTLVRQGESQETFAGEGGEWIEKTFSFEFKGKKSGAAKIPSFELTYIAPAEQKTGKLLIPLQTLTVTKKDHIKLFTILALFAAFGVGLALRLKKIFGRWKEGSSDESSLPAEETNLENFKKFLEANSFLTHQFTVGLTPHLKHFLEEGYGVKASGHTIHEQEIIQQLEAKGLGRDEIYEIKTILRTWEEINYAGRVSDENFREFRTQLLRLIQNKKAVSL